MKKCIQYLFIIIIASSIFYCCSKKDSSSSENNCSNPSTCLVNSWYMHQWYANYNGSTVTIYSQGGNSNLDNGIAGACWKFTSDNKWIGFGGTIIRESGTWKMENDNKTVIITSVSESDTFSITNITAGSLSLIQAYNHQYPSINMIELAFGSGLDTAKLTSYMVDFTNSP